MKPPFPSATPTWHNDTYPSFSPSRPELSVAGKAVVIAGAVGLFFAASGIGRETASAFSDAGASKIVLLGRNEANLLKTKSALVPNSTSCSIHAVSVTDKKALMDVAAQAGAWDILILSAAFVSSPASVAESPVEDWWQSFEVGSIQTHAATTSLSSITPSDQYKGHNGCNKGFTPDRKSIARRDPRNDHCTSGLPPAMLPGLSAYIGSKLAQVQFLEILAAENPNVFVASVHPGMVETSLFRKSGAKDEALPIDEVQLPAQFMVWANWDVDELKSQAQEIQSGQQITSGVIGGPFQHMG